MKIAQANPIIATHGSLFHMRFTRIAITIVFLLFHQLFTGCSTRSDEEQLIILCSIEKNGESYSFPLEKVVIDRMFIASKLHKGTDMSGNGLKYRGDKLNIYPNRILVFYSVKRESSQKSPKVKMVRSLAVIDDKLPALGNQSLSEFVEALKK